LFHDNTKDFLKAKGDEKESFRNCIILANGYLFQFLFMVSDSLGVLVLGYFKPPRLLGLSAAYTFAFAFLS